MICPSKELCFAVLWSHINSQTLYTSVQFCLKMICLSQAEASPLHFVCSLSLTRECMFLCSQLLGLKQSRTLQEGVQTPPALGLWCCSSPPVLQSLSCSARSYLAMCMQQLFQDQDTVAELRSSVCLVFDRDIMITSAGRGRAAWAERRMRCVGKRAGSGRSYTSSQWYKLRWYKNALLSSEIHRDTSLLARDLWSHTPCWNKYASRTLHCGLEKCCIFKAKPTQAQLLAADNSSSSPAPLGADPVENTHPLLSLLPFGCCLYSGWGSSTLGCHTCHPAWCIMARSKAQALCALPAGVLWGSGPLPWCQLPALCRDCWAGRMLHRDFSSWYVGFDFIFQHRFQLNLQHMTSIVASLLVFLVKEKSNFTFRLAAEACVLSYRKPHSDGKWEVALAEELGLLSL